jgi:hypothetical protein
MMESNEYSQYDDTYNDYMGTTTGQTSGGHDDEVGLLLSGEAQFQQQARGAGLVDTINFDDPKIANLPRILLMGPRRGGKTSIQVRNAVNNYCTL